MPGSRSLCRTGAVWCLLVMFLQATVVHPRHICLVNKANNVHTASLFLRKTLEKHGSKNNYSVVLGNKQSPCPADAEARVFLIMPKYLQQLYGSCTGNNLCIVTGDESCFAPTEKWPKSHRTFVIDNPPPEPWLSQMLEEAKNDPCRDDSPGGLEWEDIAGDVQFNTALREYSSSKYIYPGVALGARVEFKPVSRKMRMRGARRLLFNFIGTIKDHKQEVDREHMRDVVEQHDWGDIDYRFKVVSDVAQEPDQYAVEEYRVTLIASSFTLSPVGISDDTFRFWEAIEAGSIPIFVRRAVSNGGVPVTKRPPLCPDAFEDVLSSNPPVVLLDSWATLPAFLQSVTNDQIDDMRHRLLRWENEFWRNTSQIVDEAIDKGLAHVWRHSQRAKIKKTKCLNKAKESEESP